MVCQSAYQVRNNRNEYLWKIGDRRIDRITEEYRTMGFLVWANKQNHKGVDIIIISTPDGRVVKVIESANYGKYTREGKLEVIAKDKLQRYYYSLNYWDSIEGIKKEIVVSFKENIPSAWYKKFTEAKITVIIVGCQD